MNILPWRHRQLLLVLFLAVAICYAIPMDKKYDPFLKNNKIYANREFDLISSDGIMDGDVSISNITALARSKRSCCGCCCCCCCWYISHYLNITHKHLKSQLNENAICHI